MTCKHNMTAIIFADPGIVAVPEPPPPPKWCVSCGALFVPGLGQWFSPSPGRPSKTARAIEKANAAKAKQ